MSEMLGQEFTAARVTSSSVNVSLDRPAGRSPDRMPIPRAYAGAYGQFRRHHGEHPVTRRTGLMTMADGVPGAGRFDPSSVIREDAAAVAEQLPPGLGGATVLVTGANGMLGTYVTAILQAAGAQVVTAERHGDQLLIPMELFDHIIHAGALTDPDEFQRDPVRMLTASTSALKELLECARRCGAHLTLVSAVDDMRRLDLADPRSFCSTAERAGEALCAAYRKEYGVASSIIRLAYLYGPGFPVTSTEQWAVSTRAAASGDAVVVRSSDSTRVPWTYVADAADAVIRTALSGSERESTVAFEAVNDRSPCDIRAFARAALHSAGRPPALAYQLGSPGPAGDLVAERLHPAVRPAGWHPRTSVHDGLDRTVRWYQAVLSADRSVQVVPIAG